MKNTLTLDDIRDLLKESGLAFGAMIQPELMLDSYCDCCPGPPEGEEDDWEGEHCPNWWNDWDDCLCDFDTDEYLTGAYYFDASDWKRLDEYSSWANPSYLDCLEDYIDQENMGRMTELMIQDKVGHMVERGSARLFIDEGYGTIGPVLHPIDTAADLMKWLTPAMRNHRLTQLGI